MEQLLPERGDLFVNILEFLLKNLVLLVPVLNFIHHLDVFRAQLSDVSVLFRHQFLVPRLLVDQLGLKRLGLGHNYAAEILILPVGT